MGPLALSVFVVHGVGRLDVGGHRQVHIDRLVSQDPDRVGLVKQGVAHLPRPQLMYFVVDLELHPPPRG